MTRMLSNSVHERDIAALLHPSTNARAHLTTGPQVFDHGDGVYIYDDAGNRYLEGASALWCCSLGFANERLAKVAYDAMKRLGYYQIFRHASNEAAVTLADKLLDIAPVPMSKVLLQCSGSEANDTALKLVWYHWNAQGRPQKRKVISRLESYHGSTIGTICLTGIPDFHKGFGMPYEGYVYAECPHWYRDHVDGESEEEFSQRMADSLEALILREGPDTIGAFFCDPIQGGGAGALPPPKGYFERVQAILRKYDILLVADEVICGFGRTGAMWGSQTCGLQPDLVTCAKALSAAMQPVSAVLISDKVFQSILTQSDRIGAFVHGFTYGGHPVACAVANEVLTIYEEMDMLGHVKALDPHFRATFEGLADHPLIGHYSGHGLMGGLQIVADKKTRRPFPEGKEVGPIMDRLARKHGLILRTTKHRISLAPPLIITAEQITEMADRLRRALDEALMEVRAA